MTTDRSCAIVSGAASGMGSAVAARFAREGWRVVGIDLAPGALAPGIVPLAADVAERAALEAALPAAVGDATLRAVVNAAGIYPPSTLADYDAGSYRRIFDVNVLGTLNVIAAAAPFLRAAGGGAIVNFASVDAFDVSPGQLLYSASKAAVVALTRSLAIELAGDGIVSTPSRPAGSTHRATPLRAGWPTWLARSRSAGAPTRPRSPTGSGSSAVGATSPARRW